MIVFNFPHRGKPVNVNVNDAGLGIKDKEHNVQSNQSLIHDFIASAMGQLRLQGSLTISSLMSGEIHITLKRGEPYDSWHIVRTGLSVPNVRLKNSFDFEPPMYPGE